MSSLIAANKLNFMFGFRWETHWSHNKEGKREGKDDWFGGDDWFFQAKGHREGEGVEFGWFCKECISDNSKWRFGCVGGLAWVDR